MNIKEIYKNLYLIETTKYKENNVYIRFNYKCDFRDFIILKILALMIFECSLKYPSKQSYIEIKDDLFGFGAGCFGGHTSNVPYLFVNFSFINSKFIEDLKDEDIIDFINDSLFHPILNDELLTEAKKNFKDEIIRELDNPTGFLFNRFMNEMSKMDNKFIFGTHCSLNEIDSITLDEVNRVYKEIFNNHFMIFLAGDFSQKIIDYFKSITTDNSITYGGYKVANMYKLDDVFLTKDCGQSSIYKSYSLPVTRYDKDFYAAILANIIFGNMPSSLLFENVREKNSLCYAINSAYSGYEGFLFVRTSFDSKNYQKVIDEISKQYIRMKKQDYDISLLDSAKKLQINRINGIFDEAFDVTNFLSAALIFDNYVSIEDYISNINKVTIDDITRVFNKSEECLLCYLEGTKHE